MTDDMKVKLRIKRELRWFLFLFAAPCGLWILSDALSSDIPFPERLCTLEDTCAYGLCFVLPALLYISVRGLLLLYDLIRRLGR